VLDPKKVGVVVRRQRAYKLHLVVETHPAAADGEGGQ
jgi:hypothetical protein